MDGKSGVPNKRARMAMGMQEKQFIAGKCETKVGSYYQNYFNNLIFLQNQFKNNLLKHFLQVDLMKNFELLFDE